MNLVQQGLCFILLVLLVITSLLFLEAFVVIQDSTPKVVTLLDELNRMENVLDKDEALINNLMSKFNDDKQLSHSHDNDKYDRSNANFYTTEPIPVLVFACNRVDAIKNHLEKLISYRKSPALFPIFVSHDCDNLQVFDAVREFKSHVNYVKQESGSIHVPSEHRRYAMYYKIARHYKLGFGHVFDKLNYSSVIVTEDDLDISKDFFNYFNATRKLLERDNSLYCVSAWNDNGSPDFIDLSANDLLYRSDFFPGLGWMMTRNLWDELKEKWPQGFWDDWIREPEQRRNRSCIRPEVSRTSMTQYGRIGASKGLFFNKHLRFIALNDRPVDFTRRNLDYLLKSNYDAGFIAAVYSLPTITVDTFMRTHVLDRGSVQTTEHKAFRIEYETMLQYTEIARKLHIMIDTKAGVPRTAYAGVVTCFAANTRLYIAPASQASWVGYDRHWQPPLEPTELIVTR